MPPIPPLCVRAFESIRERRQRHRPNIIHPETIPEIKNAASTGSDDGEGPKPLATAGDVDGPTPLATVDDVVMCCVCIAMYTSTQAHKVREGEGKGQHKYWGFRS
jgi:hypothetical protein